uniref:Uncharacterized protein n=1 Tax=Rhizophora mucronata TaxID=61149 RepID=A0A2P2KY22_RHIMU
MAPQSHLGLPIVKRKKKQIMGSCTYAGILISWTQEEYNSESYHESAHSSSSHGCHCIFLNLVVEIKSKLNVWRETYLAISVSRYSC